MQKATIRPKILFADMLHSLQLLEPIYHLHQDFYGNPLATVRFYASSAKGFDICNQMSFVGFSRNSTQQAEDAAARQAIEYMQTYMKVELEDYNYRKLKITEQENKKLRRQLQLNRSTIKELSRGWASTIQGIDEACHDNLIVFQENFEPSPETDAEAKLSQGLLKVEDTARSLERLSIQATELLQTIGVYLYGNDDGEEPSYEELEAAIENERAIAATSHRNAE